MKRFYLLLFVFFLGTACSSVLSPDSTEGSLPDDAVVIYGRSGGFAGLQQEWTIHPDGRIILPDGSQKQVAAAQAQAVFDAIQSANFRSLNAAYLPEDTCCDLFSYSVTVQTGSESQTITTMDGAANVPESLTAVFQAIDNLIQTID
jgi:hypothetical protein